MNAQETTVGSLGDLIDSVMHISERMEWSPVWFRGQRDRNWHLEPTAKRNARVNGANEQYETNLVHRFRGRAPLLGADVGPSRNAAWLQAMQHHGLPTRLLDWSRSPLVAAYFAVEKSLISDEEAAGDAAIWCLDPHGLNRRATPQGDDYTPTIESGTARVLVDGAFYGDESARRSGKARWSTGQSTLVPDERTPEHFEGHAEHLAVMAYESDIRMLVQQGSFTIHSFDSEPIDQLYWAHEVLWKIVIPADRVRILARQLEVVGITEAGIYPDLDHLSKELMRTGRSVGITS